MDMIAIGKNLRELRREKGMTQEQLAEHFNVARRTVSRWETGSNMPDLDILIEMSDFYDVDLRELLDGERTEEKMDKELKETVLKVAEYINEEKRRSLKVTQIYFIISIVALIVNNALYLMDIKENFRTDFVKGCTLGFVFTALLFGLMYTTGAMEKMHAFKMRLLGRKDQ